VDIGIRCLFSSYWLDDFQWNDLAPYRAGVTQDDSARDLLLAATFDDYAAQLAEFFVTIRFGRDQRARGGAVLFRLPSSRAAGGRVGSDASLWRRPWPGSKYLLDTSIDGYDALEPGGRRPPTSADPAPR
jgi:hypothetical protein